MNANMKHLERWCAAKRLTINSKKTKYVLFDNHKKGHAADSRLEIRINDDLLEGTDCYNYLGILLDSSLTFKSHIGRTLNTCSTYVFTLAKIRKYITSTVAVQIYKSLVMSRLNFGGMLCLGAPKTSLSRLQKLQNRAYKNLSMWRQIYFLYSITCDLKRSSTLFEEKTRNI